MFPPARPALTTALLAVALLGSAARAADQLSLPAPSLPAADPAPAKPAPLRMAQATKVEPRPTWSELTALQQQALAPLIGTWGRLSEAHKRKWLAVSANYPTMPPGEQARLHSRMAEWAALSPQQRNQARLNFAETQQVATDDKKGKWDAYQALPEDEKRKLAAGAAAAKPVAPPTAAAVQPVPSQKLTKAPAKPTQPDSRVPRIAAAPNQVDHNTLLPQPGALPVQP